MSVFMKAYLSITIYAGQPDSINYIVRECILKYSEDLGVAALVSRFRMREVRGQRL